MKTKVAILVNKPMANSIFAKADLDYLAEFADFNAIDDLPEKMTIEFMREQLKYADCAITCWGTPNITDELIDNAPNLKFIAHAAGSVKNIIPARMWRERKTRVTSNAPIIAEAVAQTTLAFILTSIGQFWAISKSTRDGSWKGGESSTFTTKTINGLTIGIVGASLVGQEVIKILEPFKCKLLLCDPYISKYDAESLGVTLVDMDTLMKSSDIVTLHTPANEDCKHIVNANNLALLMDGALLVNTSRGVVIDESALIKELQTGRIFACLDVTDPEPPAKDHPFRSLDNVILTPHIAGGHTSNGRQKLGRASINAIFNYTVKGIIKFEVREEMLSKMA